MSNRLSSVHEPSITEDIHTIPIWEEGHEQSTDCACQPYLLNARELIDGLNDRAVFVHRTREECLG